jgi:integrase/recombinase XerD
MVTQLTLSQACEAMIRYKIAAGKSTHTISDYRNSFKKLMLFLPGSTQFTSITRSQLIDFFAWLQEDYESEPDGVAPRGKVKLAPKSILNIHTNLSALWTWAVTEELFEKNIVRTIDPPPTSAPVVETFSKDDIALLLKACDNSRTWKTRTDKTSLRLTALGDRAMILTLLDTGCRASELCGMMFGDLNLAANSIKVKGKGPGRDEKERLVYIGKRTAQVIWKYLLPWLDKIREDDPVFVVGNENDGRPIDRCGLRQLLHRLGEKAGILNTHPHRFRLTFSINYLRNGGDIFTLQALLGHSDLQMVKRYARIAETDSANAHRKASPVDNWKM